jgi:antitoxin ParD1/3/4
MAIFVMIPTGDTGMASMNISLPDPMRDYVQDRIDSGQYASASDYVRDLIRRDRGGIENEERWLRDLDGSIAQSLAEMEAGGGVDLEAACDAVLADLATADGQTRS